MKKLYKFRYYIIAFLVIVFFSPKLIQNSFFFKNHTHKICEISETHLHVKIDTCSLCDFTFTKKYYLNPKKILDKIIYVFNSYHFSFKILSSSFINFFDSRAPPVFIKSH